MSRVLPILFNTEMVRAILDGRKMVTRRIVKLPRYVSEDVGGTFTIQEEDFGYSSGWNAVELIANRYIKPKYKAGDILYVRETWGFDRGGIYIYKSTYKECFTESQEVDCIGNKIKWRPSIHMPKEAARIWLKVTDVRVERLQDMDGKDVLKEGVNSHVHPDAFYFNGNQLEMFSRLWNSTVKEDWKKYDANPWVWVIEFERCEKPEQCVIDGVEPAEDKRPCLGYGKSEIDDEPCEMCKKCNYADVED